MLEICKQSNEICNSSIENAVGRDKQNNNFWFTQKIKSYCKLEWSLNDCCHSFWHGNFLVKTLDSIHLVNNTVIHSLLIFGRQMHSNLIPFFSLWQLKAIPFEKVYKTLSFVQVHELNVLLFHRTLSTFEKIR